MGDNPFDPHDERPYSSAPTAGTPQVPISGNPFETTGVKSAPPPETLASNVADVLKPASNTFSFGMRDRLEGVQRYLQGDAPSISAGIDQAVADSAIRRERSPFLSVGGDIAGGTAQAFVPGVGAIGRSVGAALGGAGRGAMPAIARMTGYGVEGGLLGAGQAAGHTYTGNPQDYAKNALIGGALGATVGAPFGAVADVAPRSMAQIPTSQELRGSARGSYTATHAIPAEYSAPHFWSGVDALEQDLLRTTNPARSPGVWEALRLARQGRAQAERTPGGENSIVTPKNIDDLRQQLTGIKEPGAYQARQWLDDYMAQGAGMVRGSAADRDAIARLLSTARGDYRAGKRTETIENINQFSADKGTDPARALTNLLNPRSREGRWYTPAEKEDIRNAGRKDVVARGVQMGGNVLGGGGGPWGPAAYGGAGISGAIATGDLTPLLTLGAPIVGMGLKVYGNRLATQSAESLADRMAMNSPLYRTRAANAPVLPGPGLGNTAEATRNALTLEMLQQLRQRGVMEGTNAP